MRNEEEKNITKNYTINNFLDNEKEKTPFAENFE
jgi:hypothetical protein